MKKILSILGAISLIGTSTTSLISCNDSKKTTQKVNNVAEWKGVQLHLNYFIKNIDNKYYAISRYATDKQQWTNFLLYNDDNENNRKFSLEPDYKVWEWTLESTPSLPSINENGDII